VAPPSRFSCWKCQAASAEVPFCRQCGALQEVPSRLSFFEVLEIPVQLRVDSEKLREKFHELAKRLHPDRFSAHSGPEAAYSLRWTTLLNRAYQTLRDPTERSYYVLEQNGVSPEQRGGKIPLELAEVYFELQDLESGSEERLKAFQGELKQQLQATESAWDALAARWEPRDAGVQQEVLGDLKENLVKQRYLRSMLSDLQTKLGVSGGDRRN
jgi:molecular chaperone HscB